jgi:hypothetical protein
MHHTTGRVKGFYAKMKGPARLESKRSQKLQGSSMLVNGGTEKRGDGAGRALALDDLVANCVAH